VKEVSNNKGYEAEGNALKHNVSLQKQGQKRMFIHTNCEEVTQLPMSSFIWGWRNKGINR